MGAWDPSVTVQVANEVSIPGGVLQITPASTTDTIAKLDDRGLVNRTVMPDSYQSRALAQVIEDDLGGAGGRTVNVAAEANSYGDGLANAFVSAWKQRGGSVGKRVDFGPEQASYAGEAEQLTAGKPDVFVVFSFASAFSKLAGALRETGRWDANRTYASDALAVANLPEVAGAEATEGLRGTVPGVLQTAPAANAFDRLYASALGAGPQTFAAQAFDPVILCYLSAVSAGEADSRAMADNLRQVSSPPGKKYTWQMLADAIEAIEFDGDIDYDGASGPIDMNAAGDATRAPTTSSASGTTSSRSMTRCR